MQQPEALNLVAEFHTTFKHPILKTPQVPDENRCKLRVALLAEELKELEVAILQKDIVEVADALCDIQYVLSRSNTQYRESSLPSTLGRMNPPSYSHFVLIHMVFSLKMSHNGLKVRLEPTRHIFP